MRAFVSLGFLFIFAGSTFGQVTFEIGPSEIGINQLLQFVVKLDGTENPRPGFPSRMDTGDFMLVQSQPSYSRNINMINGKTESFETFTYVLKPKRKGTLTFPAQIVRFKGKDYTSPAKKITVGDEVQQRRPRSPLDDFFNRNREPGKIWIELETEKTSYYKGEPMIMTVRAYWTRNVQWTMRRSYIEMPELEGFWVEEIETTGETSRVRKENQTVYTSLLAARLMYANKTGEVTIDPARLIVDGFGGPTRYESKPFTVEVKSLPTAGRPDDFSGLVGEFELKSELDKDQVKAGESVSVNVELDGLGNLALITDLKPIVADGAFEIFDGGAPETLRVQGVPRKKTWRYALVPQASGSYKVDEPKISFFDTTTKKYRTVGGASFDLNVLEGETLVGGTTAPGQTTIDIKQSLSYIMLDPLSDLDQREELTPPTRLVQLAGGLAGMNLLVFLFVYVRNHSLSRQANMRPRFAMRNYKKTVSKLKVQDGASDAFYGALSQAILNYFGDKWERTGQGISLDTIHETFHRKEIDETLYQKVAECIEACDLARFTPSSPSSRESLIQKANDVIAEVEAVL